MYKRQAFKSSELIGYLYVIVAGERYENAHNRVDNDRQAQLSMVVLAGALFFLFIVMLGIFYYFTRPLRLLNRDINKLKEVGFDKSQVSLAQWMPNSSNEVHQLGVAFEGMVNQINTQLNLLQQSDAQRRELLADISHDLRTPLSSLQGYLETISLKSNELSEQSREKYLNTVLKNTFQLKSLIDQIFELAHLDGGQVSLNFENFNLAELIYDVVAKFNLAASAKHINISVEPISSYTQVYSDIGKLERVISNLLENAIRHTGENGHIVFTIEECSENECRLTLSDDGTGIKAEELSYIFDTRYRASNAVQDKNKHTGLGLAITKKLLELLKSDIKVQSTLGKGTSFSFKLRRVNN